MSTEGRSAEPVRRLVGTMGRLVVFFWSISLLLIAPPNWIPLAVGTWLGVAVLLHPAALRVPFRRRWILLFGFLIVANIFWVGELDWNLWGLAVSSEGLLIGLQMVLRAVVVLVAVEGFSNSVDIAEVAGLLERFGLEGLGFSMGVAVNLLPFLRQSSLNAWRSLRMKGGLRRQRWRGLRLLLVNIIGNALCRADEVVLSAEARAFSPDRSRIIPLEIGAFDWLILTVGLSSLLALILVR